MRILLLSPLYPPAIGGAASYFADIVPLLVKHPDIEQVVLVTEKMPGEPQETIEGKLTVLRLLPTRVSRERPYLIHALTYIQTQLWFQRSLAKLVEQYQIDLVQFHTRFRGRATYQALAQLPVPVLADLRDKMSDPADLAQCSHHLLCCAQGVANFAATGGYPVNCMTHIPLPFVPPQPLSTTAIQAAQQQIGRLIEQQQSGAAQQQFGVGKRPYLLYVGDITVNKGVYELLDAFTAWQTPQPGIELVMAGVNREGQRFTDRVSQVPQTYFLGHIPHAQLLALMQGAEMVVLPSRSEGLPLTILEAVALGKKVLCPPHIPEFETHLPEFALPEVTAAAIAETLNTVWHNPATPQYPLANHRAETIVAKLVDVYQTMMEKRA